MNPLVAFSKLIFSKTQDENYFPYLFMELVIINTWLLLLL